MMNADFMFGRAVRRRRVGQLGATRWCSGAPLDQIVTVLAGESRYPARIRDPQRDATEHAGFTTGTRLAAGDPNDAQIDAEAAVADLVLVFHHQPPPDRVAREHPVVVEVTCSALLLEHEQLRLRTPTW